MMKLEAWVVPFHGAINVCSFPCRRKIKTTACTEMVLPISSNGTSDMFPPSYYNLTEMTAYCQSAFGVTPRPYWMTTTYGGVLTPEGTNNIQGSNIVFSNGMLDP